MSNPDGTGWNFGHARVDGLENVFEEAVSAAKKH
jgi:hypothetical protein